MSNTSLTSDKVGSYAFLAEPFHCDFAQRLTMGHLGNHLLNAADYHAAARGFGMVELAQMQRSWVLSRLAIEVKAMPKAYDRFTVETWVENVMRYFTNRNFAILAEDGTPIGYGRSVWAMIDTQTRQPQNILQVHDGALADYILKEKECPIAKSSRVNVSDSAVPCGEVKTGYSDIDVNGHVNSIRYIEHVLNLFPLDWFSEHPLRRFEIAYVAEAYAGDILYFYREQTDENTWTVRLTTRHTPSDDVPCEEKEVARCGLVF